MSETMIERPSPVPLPAPRVPVTVRAGTMDDLPFMDRLQKLHGKQVGFMPTRALEGKINAGHVLVAVGRVSDPPLPGSSVGDGASPADGRGGSETRPTGYVIGADRYFKRDDVGIVYQMNVDPSAQRGLVGATLLQALFDRAAYGCRLFCCWCAQDIAANRFWESMGFVPLAFRTGGRGRAMKKGGASSSLLHPSALIPPPEFTSSGRNASARGMKRRRGGTRVRRRAGASARTASCCRSRRACGGTTRCRGCCHRRRLRRRMSAALWYANVRNAPARQTLRRPRVFRTLACQRASRRYRRRRSRSGGRASAWPRPRRRYRR